MATARFKIDKFTGMNDFGLWRIKMKALLVQQGIVNAVLELASKEGEDVKKVSQEIEMKAHSAILLSLGDEVLREVAEEESALGYGKNLLSTRRKFRERLMTSQKLVEKDCYFKKSKSGHNSNSKNRNVIGKKCYYCKKEGHFRDDCYLLKNKLKRDKSKERGEAGIVSSGYDSADVLVVSCEDSGGEWILDSGCSFHMTPNKDLFTHFEESSVGTVLLGNNKACKIIGTGTVNMKMHDGIIRSVQNVRYVPDLKRNLLSIGKFDNHGYTVKIDKGTLNISRGSLVVVRGRLKNGLYYMVGTAVTGTASPAINNANNDIQLWHLRLGHVSERGLIELDKQGLFQGGLNGKLGLCEECVYGKSCRVKFATSQHTTKEKLAYIHSNLWGPSRIKTLGGASYFISIVDDFSRKVWVFLLKSKDEAFNAFVNWKRLIENQTKCKIRKLKTDNGWEYCSKQFDEFCKEHGIARHLTVRDTPQQNGLAERMNRTLIERVRCMLKGASLDRTFWGEAVKTTCYLINRCPSVPLRQDKLQPRALKCMFLGYPEGVKGYKLWCLEPGHKKCIISRDVVFNEEEMAMKKSVTATALETSSQGDQIEVDTTQSSSIEDSETTKKDNIETNTQTSLSSYQLIDGTVLPILFSSVSLLAQAYKPGGIVGFICWCKYQFFNIE
uniref:Retrovirus-related Pol polyprotein from transposon TNT 1-94 n=1 Tax=Cannabis sativa TaxID=3483 RepID=A0A803PS03_CANSA